MTSGQRLDPPRPAGAGGEGTPGPLRVLVADDFEPVRMLAVRMLQKLGYSEIEEAEDGQQAVDALAARRFDLLFLDLALEDFLRRAIEQQQLSQFDRDALVELIHWTLRNLTCSVDSPELGLCGRHWEKLKAQPRTGKDWALHAKSVADRAGRWVQVFSDEVYQRLQPKAEALAALQRAGLEHAAVAITRGVDQTVVVVSGTAPGILVGTSSTVSARAVTPTERFVP